MIGYDLMENDKPVNTAKYDGIYSTTLFTKKAKDIIYSHDPEKVVVRTLKKSHGFLASYLPGCLYHFPFFFNDVRMPLKEIKVLLMMQNMKTITIAGSPKPM